MRTALGTLPLRFSLEVSVHDAARRIQVLLVGLPWVGFHDAGSVPIAFVSDLLQQAGHARVRQRPGLKDPALIMPATFSVSMPRVWYFCTWVRLTWW